MTARVRSVDIQNEGLVQDCEALRLPQGGAWRRCPERGEYEAPNGKRVCWVHMKAIASAERGARESVIFATAPGEELVRVQGCDEWRRR